MNNIGSEFAGMEKEELWEEDLPLVELFARAFNASKLRKSMPAVLEDVSDPQARTKHSVMSVEARAFMTPGDGQARAQLLNITINEFQREKLAGTLTPERMNL